MEHCISISIARQNLKKAIDYLFFTQLIIAGFIHPTMKDGSTLSIPYRTFYKL